MENNGRMDTFEENLKFLSDSLVEQRRAQMKNDARAEARFEKSEEHLAFMEKHLRHLTQLVGIAYDDLQFVGEKAEETGKRLNRKTGSK